MARVIDDPDIDSKVLEAVGRRTPQANNSRIVNVQKRFLKGSLFTVSFEGFPDSVTGVAPSFFNRVYVHGNSLDVYGHDESLLNIVGETHMTSAWELFGNTKVVSGIIASIMTLVVLALVGVSLYRSTAVAIPEIISSGWLIILGFYFGKMGGKDE